MARLREPSLWLCALAIAPLVLELCFATRALPPPPQLPEGRLAEDVPLTASEQELLRGIPVTKRRYVIGGHPVLVLSLDAAMDRHVLHEPTYCLKGKGWTVTLDEVRAVRAGCVRQVTAVHAPTRQVRRFVHFFRSGDRWYTSRWQHLADYTRARWWPGARAPLNHVTLLSECTDQVSDAWIRQTALPALFGPDADPIEISRNFDPAP